MKFIDLEHKQFYEKKIQEIGKDYIYRKSLIYTLAICPVTREHFADIFNLKDGEINIKSINAAYQTDTSAKVTRMAFSLWNRCNYDSEEDIENNKPSIYYNPSEIFCCGYAPYFYEAMKIRYPEYTRYNNTITDVIQLVRDKYSDIVRLNLFKNTLTLEYMHLINGEKDCYQLIEVSEFGDKLKIEFLTQHITRVIDIDELENIFEMLHRQSTHKPLSKEEIQKIKDKYKIGTKIKMNKLNNKPISRPGLLGNVEKIDEFGNIIVRYKTLGTETLVEELDDFEILKD